MFVLRVGTFVTRVRHCVRILGELTSVVRFYFHRHRWVLYLLSFSQSPQQQFDEACSRAWTKEHGMHATARLDKAAYGLLQEALQDFTPARPIFLHHRIDHPLCASAGFTLVLRRLLRVGVLGRTGLGSV